MIEQKWTAEEIKGLRLALGMNQKEFALEIGVVTRTVIHWENPNNKHQPLKMAKRGFRRLAKKLKKSQQDTTAAIKVKRCLHA